ncbi:MAG: tungsten formylmethanofuran dehydrogenase [Candidatus Schekmanbacteria bacterium RBG_16_38_10]|uniref:Tungsten formylmethanofuran dehydrogenase n=1 Tax=Candidatus Schekmanbacteria bacterium RBG_16_38_10 TaxID=1817879 RepID=A0A1F7RWH1_9BACT|nr:MAG: tungsten formylmethanofuran dehydrogenase [Candidatus Schekmanbacteria bacterium RBG_16_38_10]
MTKPKAKEIKINTKWCKGCEICVAFCPTKVLEIKGFVSSVRDLDACIVCKQCEIRCPDFCIEVIA